ncbi:hypothetical protein Ddye_000360 [Dipteronia dyeriana]|uniref:Uncharacterized protein n=1 Tax=Dipteronia dyeriana TaxID=168575 RepID=A0AAD9XLH1_9ROSI|nr:hypothetical protein Ddye_000360 [Dipteronia dyeriana]
MILPVYCVDPHLFQTTYHFGFPVLKPNILFGAHFQFNFKLNAASFTVIRCSNLLRVFVLSFSVSNLVCVQIKQASMKLAQMYMKRVSTDLELVRNSDWESTQEALFLQGVHFAYRAHQFAGGLDSETLCAFEEIRRRIIAIKDIIRPPMKENFNDVYIGYELMDTDLHQIIRSHQDLTDDHCRFIGSPDEFGLAFLRSDNARRYVRMLPQFPKQNVSIRFPNVSPDAVDLLEKMLKLVEII